MTDRLSNYFDEATRVVLKEGVSSWRALKRHEDWNHWLNVGHAIATAQDIAATYANGQTSGKRFNEFMGQCYDSPSYLRDFADMDKSERSYAAKCWREREAIEKFRQNVGATRARQMNHPKVVWQAFEASRRTPSERKLVASPFEKTKQELAVALEREHEKEKEIARLKKDQDGEVSFSYRDSSTNIAKFLISALGDRLPSVLKEITKQRDKRAGR